MKRLSHFIWFVRWLQRLGSAVPRRRKVIDLLPSLLVRKRPTVPPTSDRAKVERILVRKFF